jgi:O-antigen/teichoic acid export membrane protein
VLLARVLGPAGRGEYFLFVAVLTILTRLADLGFSAAGVVYAGRFPRAQAHVHDLLVWLVFVRWVLAALIVLLVTTLTGSMVAWPPERTLLLLLILPSTLYEQLWTHLMVGTRRVLTMNLVQTGAGALSLAMFCVVLIWNDGGLAAALAAYGIVAIGKSVVMFLIARHATRPHEGARFERIRVQEMLWFGMRSYPNGLAALLWTRLPALMLAAIHGPAVLGIFSVAQQAIEQLLMPAQSAQDAIYQRITALPRERATAAMNRYLRVFLSGMVTCSLACAALAPWSFGVILGPAFDGSVTVFQILVISATVTVIPALLTPYFVGQLGRPGLVSLLTWGRVLIALVLVVPLARQFAAAGVAAGLAIADLSFTVLMLSLYVRIARTQVGSAMMLRADDVAVVYARARALLQV